MELDMIETSFQNWDVHHKYSEILQQQIFPILQYLYYKTYLK